MALDLEVPADRPAQPRGGLPVDPANVILGAVFAQRFERRAGASPAVAMAARLPQQCSPLGQLGRLGVRQVGQAANLQAGRQPLLRPGKPERPANPIVEIAEGGHAALGRDQLVVEGRAGPGRHVHFQRGRVGASPVRAPDRRAAAPAETRSGSPRSRRCGRADRREAGPASRDTGASEADGRPPEPIDHEGGEERTHEDPRGDDRSRLASAAEDDGQGNGCQPQESSRGDDHRR